MKTNHNKTSFSHFREKIVHANHKVASFFGRNRTVAFITLLFVGFDVVSLYLLFNLVFPPTADFALYSTVLSLALCLNVPLGLAGGEIKKAMQKLVSWKYAIKILALAVVGFMLVFGPFAMFRMNTRDMLFQTEAGTGLVSMVEDISAETTEAEQDAEDITQAGGILMSLMPVVTSIGSFLINLIFADPLGDRLFELDKQKVRLENKRLQLLTAIAQVKDPEQYQEEMFNLEAKRYAAMNEKLNAQRVVLKEVFAVLMMVYLANPNAISCIEEHAQKILQKHEVDISQVKFHCTDTDNTRIAA